MATVWFFFLGNRHDQVLVGEKAQLSWLKFQVLLAYMSIVVGGITLINRIPGHLHIFSLVKTCKNKHVYGKDHFFGQLNAQSTWPE